MRYTAIATGIFALLLLAAQSVVACTCVPPRPPCEAYGSSAAVFVGTALSVRDTSRRKGDLIEYGPLSRTFKFLVEQSYLGVNGSEIEVSTGIGGGDCGYNFKIGERYLVYAYRAETQLATGICSRTKPFVNSDEDLAFLGSLSSRRPGATIYGQVTRGTTASPLASDIVITLESESTRREIRPDSEGRYNVSGLPAGKFKVSLQLPETLITNQPVQEISVANRGCAAVHFHVTDNGRVSGRVFDVDGQPIARILIALVEPTADPKKDYVGLEHTDEEGRFSFKAVPAGQYVIAINFNRFANALDPTNSYPPSFYPGVLDQRQASVITLGAGEKLIDLHARVPSRRPVSTLEGQVVWSDGSPVANANLSVTDVTEREGNLTYGSQANAEGRFKIDGYVGQKVVVSAHSTNPPSTRTESVRLTLQKPIETIKITLTRSQ